MPAPSDVQATNGSATLGRAETGDTITFTFDGPVIPSLVLAGWTGSATDVTVHLNHLGATSWLTVLDTGGATLSALGAVDLAAHYSNGSDIDFTASTMTATGNTVTVVLGTPSNSAAKTVSVPGTMAWWLSGSSVSESGLPDVEF
jgi:chitinase